MRDDRCARPNLVNELYRGLRIIDPIAFTGQDVSIHVCVQVREVRREVNLLAIQRD